MKSFSIVALSLSLYPIISAASTSTETDSFPTYSNSTQDVNPHDLSTESGEVWMDVSVGMMMYQNEAHKYMVEYPDEDQNNQREKRGLVQIEESRDGNWELAKRSSGSQLRKVKRGSTINNAKVTWYAGHDLDNPGCQVKSHWNPSDASMVCAWKESSKFANCGDFIKICNKKTNRCTTCRKVDFCQGCDNSHIDLSPGSFKQLGSLNTGVINNLVATKVKQPFSNSKWSSMMSKYGPKAL